jgi:hypothetical protein
MSDFPRYLFFAMGIRCSSHRAWMRAAHTGYKECMTVSPTLRVPMPVRRSRRFRPPARYSGWSPKIGRRIEFATRLEYLNWLLLEGTPEVVELCEHYPEIQLESQYYVFDMWARWDDGREECLEVVAGEGYPGISEFDLASSGWSAICRWGRQQGYSCERITEAKLAPRARRIQNSRRMLPFVQFALEHPDPEMECVVLLRLLLADLSIRELVRCYPSEISTDVTAVVAKLLHAGKIAADLERGHFGPNLVLRLP